MSNRGNAQSDSLWLPAAKIKGKYTQAYWGHLDELYLQNDKNTLFKYSPSFQQIGLYSNTQLGMISSVSVKNPFQVVVFYADWQTIVFLDNWLNVSSQLRLSDELVQPTKLIVNQNDEIWVYDEGAQQLVLLDAQGDIRFKSDFLYQHIDDISSCSHLLATSSHLLVVLQEGVAVFDNFGNYDYFLELPQLQYPHIVSSFLVGQYQNKYIQIDLETLDQQPYSFFDHLQPQAPVHIGRKQAAVLYEQQAIIYKQ